MAFVSSEANSQGSAFIPQNAVPPRKQPSSPHQSLPTTSDKVPSAESREGSDDDGAQLKDAGGSDSKFAANNRKRIVIKPISDERSRVGTYNKRKFGVIKKAMELSILCNCKIGLFIFSESGKPVRYCSDGDFRSLLNTVAQGGSAAVRPGSAEVWDNSMYSNFNRGFGGSGKGDDDFSFDHSMLQGLADGQGGAKRQCVASSAASVTAKVQHDPGKFHSNPSPSHNGNPMPMPIGVVAPPLRVSSPLVLSSAATMHSRSQSSAGPSFSAAPMPYSASLDEFFVHNDQTSLAPFSFEDNIGDQMFNGSNTHASYAPNSFRPGLNSTFVAPELDDCISLQSGFSESGI